MFDKLMSGNQAKHVMQKRDEGFAAWKSASIGVVEVADLYLSRLEFFDSGGIDRSNEANALSITFQLVERNFLQDVVGIDVRELLQSGELRNKSAREVKDDEFLSFSLSDEKAAGDGNANAGDGHELGDLALWNFGKSRKSFGVRCVVRDMSASTQGEIIGRSAVVDLNAQVIQPLLNQMVMESFMEAAGGSGNCDFGDGVFLRAQDVAFSMPIKSVMSVNDPYVEISISF